MPRASSLLVACSGALFALLVAHDLSHALDDGLETELGPLAMVAVPQWLLVAGVMVVIARAERRRAAAAALLLGLAVTIGFVAVHLLPFSPAPYWDLRPTAVSWLLVWAPVALGAVAARLAWGELRGAAALRRAPVTHPA